MNYYQLYFAEVQLDGLWKWGWWALNIFKWSNNNWKLWRHRGYFLLMSAPPIRVGGKRWKMVIETAKMGRTKSHSVTACALAMPGPCHIQGKKNKVAFWKLYTHTSLILNLHRILEQTTLTIIFECKYQKVHNQRRETHQHGAERPLDESSQSLISVLWIYTMDFKKLSFGFVICKMSYCISKCLFDTD